MAGEMSWMSQYYHNIYTKRNKIKENLLCFCFFFSQKGKNTCKRCRTCQKKQSRIYTGASRHACLKTLVKYSIYRASSAAAAGIHLNWASWERVTTVRQITEYEKVKINKVY